jgi:hypothetical protein
MGRVASFQDIYLVRFAVISEEVLDTSPSSSFDLCANQSLFAITHEEVVLRTRHMDPTKTQDT